MNDNGLKSIGSWIFITGTIASIVWLLAFSTFPFPGRIILASIASLGLGLYKKGYQNGPVIAIGKPGEDLPPIGAYRHYTDFDEDWQETVLRYMQQSSLIVMVLDFSEGVLWELRQIIVNKRLKDTIIFYPTTFGVSDDSTFDELWDDNFKKYIKEFPFLVTPKIGTMGLTFSNTRKPIELWSVELNLDQKIKEIETIIFERFEEKPLTPGSFIQVGIPVRR